MQNFPSMPAAIPMFKSKSGMSSISVSNLEIEIGDFVDDFAEDANAEDLDFPDGFAADDMPRSADPSREGLDPSARRSAGDVRSGDVSGDGNGRLDSRAASNATGNSRDHEVAPTPCTNEVVVRVVEFRTGGIERTNTSLSSNGDSVATTNVLRSDTSEDDERRPVQPSLASENESVSPSGGGRRMRSTASEENGATDQQTSRKRCRATLDQQRDGAGAVVDGERRSLRHRSA